jgi:hypothetical protein
MGLLDDAIREHLGLKRIRGADPDEVSRQEREALGPPIRPGPAAQRTDPVEQRDADGDAADTVDIQIVEHASGRAAAAETVTSNHRAVDDKGDGLAVDREAGGRDEKGPPALSSDEHTAELDVQGIFSLDEGPVEERQERGSARHDNSDAPRATDM